MRQYIYDLYLKYSRESLNYRISTAKIAYKKVEEGLKTRFDSWNAFNGIICLTLTCLCGDGNLTYNDYEIFKAISNCSPTYNELCATCNSLNYNLVINNIKSCGDKVIGQAAVLCAAVFACKGSYGRDEEAIIAALARY